MNISKSDVATALHDLGLAEQAVCLHSSLRSFGWVDGGSAAVVRGFLQAGCTLLVPTFTSRYAVPPPSEEEHFPRNAWPEGWTPDRDARKGFSPASEAVDRDMGAIPAAVAKWPGRARGFHPLDSFSAVGPRADELVDGQRPEAVYAPLRALVEGGGRVVLAGVGLERLTLLHRRTAGSLPVFLSASLWAILPFNAILQGAAHGCDRVEPASL